MINRLTLSFLTMILSLSAFAQIKTIEFKAVPAQVKKEKPLIDLSKVNETSPNDRAAFEPQELSLEALTAITEGARLMSNDNGKGIFILGKSKDTPDNDDANFINYLRPFENELGISVDNDLKLIESTLDEEGLFHTKIQQVFKGVPVYQGYLIAHGKGIDVHSLNGQLVMHNLERTQHSLDAKEAQQKADDFLAMQTLVDRNHNNLYGVQLEESVDLVIYRNPEMESDVRVAYHISTYPNVVERWSIFVDANSGEIVHGFRTICQLHNHDNEHDACNAAMHMKRVLDSKIKTVVMSDMPPGPEQGSGRDLGGTLRTLDTWRDGSTYYMIDASKPMFSTASDVNDPKGVVWTIDAKNTNPQSNFKTFQITTTDNNWFDKVSVSAHYNGSVAYDYFRNIHGYNSFNNKGSSLISFIHVSDPNSGGSMDNAFWNGQFMFYGDGDRAFEPLAEAIDVAGHEMSHGVIQSTAKLEYYRESGAINESFADVFGHLMDRGNWKIGEEISKIAVFPSGTMRDMKNPNNGASSGQNGWQPDHVRDQYNGSEDNGGVHINSGIPNHAFYLFVQKMASGISEEEARVKAEKVYFRVLRDYLTASSQFKDLRIAVVQATSALYGANGTEVNAAKDAFADVGIGESAGGDYQNDVNTNQGDQFVLFTNEQKSEIDIRRVADNMDFIFLRTGILSRPSVTDDGSIILFVEDDNTINAAVRQQDGSYEEQAFQNQPIWRNVIVSKDGARIAALTTEEDNILAVYDFGLGEWNDYELFNPTTAQGVSTGEVLFADAMEFDFSGEWVVYDAKNEIDQQSGSPYSYWDVSFINVFDNNSNRFYSNPRVEKLFTGLPEGTSIGNPSFSKNSDYILGFDLIEDDFMGTAYTVSASNLETGKIGEIWAQNQLGWPNFSVDDNQVIFNATANNDQVIGIVDIEDDKINAVPNSAASFIPNGRLGVWFANGERALTSTKKIIEGLDWNVTPNPVSSQLKISFNADREISGEVRIVNSIGQTVSPSQPIHLTSGQKEITLDASLWSEGLYTILFVTDSGVSTLEVIR